MDEIKRPSPEIRITTPEFQAPPEQQSEQPAVSENEHSVQPAVPVNPPTATAATVTPAAGTMRHSIESIMSEGLESEFAALDPATQQTFKQEGERTATMIEQLLQSTRVQARKILDALISWLRILPGVNRYFLEQEAKVKAERLMALKGKKV